MYIPSSELGLVVDPVIEAIAKLELEDGLRTGVLPAGALEAAAPILETPQGGLELILG